MRAVDVIRQKRDGGVLSPDEIRAFVTGATDGSWADYQCAALLMAILLKGMTLDEAAVLTDAMAHSGTLLDLGRSADGTIPVDKHSTGGVGDKTSLILAPLAAACGALVPMMSGRGLGHTGGTLDKLEAIPGFRTQLSIDELRAALTRRRCVLIGQSADVAPADKRLYSLRDVTGTVESIPLICASILSKKLTEGIGALVMDVKVGAGAFMKNDEDARALATWIVGIAERNGVRTEAFLTSMDAPLGCAVGNANEVIESIETLKGRGPADLEELSVRLASRMLVLAGVASDGADAESRVRRALASGAGVDAFRGIIEEQGGDPRVVDDYGLLPSGRHQMEIRASATGYLCRLDAELVGRGAVVLGAGRERVDSVLDYGAGIHVRVAPGQAVRTGDSIMTVTYNDAAGAGRARVLLEDAIQIGDRPLPAVPVIRDVIATT
jgi:pyrimidine-nucleoside phosphorylase